MSDVIGPSFSLPYWRPSLFAAVILSN